MCSFTVMHNLVCCELLHYVFVCCHMEEGEKRYYRTQGLL